MDNVGTSDYIGGNDDPTVSVDRIAALPGTALVLLTVVITLLTVGIIVLAVFIVWLYAFYPQNMNTAMPLILGLFGVLFVHFRRGMLEALLHYKRTTLANKASELGMKVTVETTKQ